MADEWDRTQNILVAEESFINTSSNLRGYTKVQKPEDRKVLERGGGRIYALNSHGNRRQLSKLLSVYTFLAHCIKKP